MDALKVEAIYVNDIDVGECLMKAAVLCCQEAKANVKSSVLSNDKVDAGVYIFF